MKLYLLTNMYCGGQHPGIQGIHSAVRLLGKYTFDDRDFPELSKQVFDWYEDHETVVLLQSGMDHEGLKTVVESLDALESNVSFNRYKDDTYNPEFPIIPFAEFKEPGMNYSISSVAVLCDSVMVSNMSSLRTGFITADDMINYYGDVLGNLLIKMTYMRTV